MLKVDDVSAGVPHTISPFASMLTGSIPASAEFGALRSRLVTLSSTTPTFTYEAAFLKTNVVFQAPSVNTDLDTLISASAYAVPTSSFGKAKVNCPSTNVVFTDAGYTAYNSSMPSATFTLNFVSCPADLAAATAEPPFQTNLTSSPATQVTDPLSSSREVLVGTVAVNSTTPGSSGSGVTE